MIIAIDPSLRSTGLFVEETRKTFAIAPKGHEYQALYEIFLEVNKFFRTYRPSDIVIEQLAYSRHSRGISSLAAVHGVIKVAAMHYKITIHELAPTSWKSFIFGGKRTGWPKKGKSKKITMQYLDAVKKATGHGFKTTDEADAYMIYKTYINGTDTLLNIART